MIQTLHVPLSWFGYTSAAIYDSSREMGKQMVAFQPVARRYRIVDRDRAKKIEVLGANASSTAASASILRWMQTHPDMRAATHLVARLRQQSICSLAASPSAS